MEAIDLELGVMLATDVVTFSIPGAKLAHAGGKISAKTAETAIKAAKLAGYSAGGILAGQAAAGVFSDGKVDWQDSSKLLQALLVLVDVKLTSADALKAVNNATITPNAPTKASKMDGTPIESPNVTDELANEMDEAIGRLCPTAGVCNIADGSCFVAGTPIRVPGGFKLIEELKVGDAILSRSEDDPNGAVRESVVEKVFKLSGQTVRLVVSAVAELAGTQKWDSQSSGTIEEHPFHIVQRNWDEGSIAGFVEAEASESQTIVTTGEHPFYVEGLGWVKAFELTAGDLLATEDGRSVVVEFAEATGQLESVYNLRVAQDHTYFVGTPEWGFAIWVHNQYGIPVNKQTGAFIPDADGLYRVRDVHGNVTHKNGVPEEFSDLELAKVRMREVNDHLFRTGKWKDLTRPSGQIGDVKGNLNSNGGSATPNPSKLRGIELENESAVILAKKGYKVEQNPTIAIQQRNPDYLIQGKIFDCYAPGPMTIPAEIVKKMNQKVADQAKRIVLNLTDNNVSRHELREAIAKFGRDDLTEVILIDSTGAVVKFFP